MSDRWIVISNCQSFGLASCLDALLPGVECRAVDIWQAAREAQADVMAFADYDLAITLPEVQVWPEFAEVRWPERLTVPSFEFSGYTPDIAYVFADGVPLKGAMGLYHSLIALAAFKEGLSVGETAARFTGELFAALGYLDRWSADRHGIVATFREHALAIDPLFWTLGRGQSFMHTIDHPAIDVLLHVARLVAARAGAAALPLTSGPVDRLADVRWPVYPPIADRLAVAGSYLFVPPDGRKPMELDAFVAASFACFSAWDRSRLRVTPVVQPILQRCRRILAGER